MLVFVHIEAVQKRKTNVATFENKILPKLLNPAWQRLTSDKGKKNVWQHLLYIWRDAGVSECIAVF